MKTVVYNMFNSKLNLFKLRNGKVVHIPTEALWQIKESNFPDIACFVQTKQVDGQVKDSSVLACRADLMEYSIKEAVILYQYYGASEINFEIKELL